jgi:hypothetical protein
MWIEEDVKGTFHDKFEKIFALQQTWKDAELTKYEVLCGLDQMWKNALMT